MRGWKPVERHIPDAVPLEEAQAVLTSEGFEVRVDNPEHSILTRSGTQLTSSGDKLPTEVALARADEGLHLQLRYDTFVLFDTGDLEDMADGLASRLSR